MADHTSTAATSMTIALGLVTSLVLLTLPGHAMHAIYAIIITPLVSALATGTELLLRGRAWSGLALIASVALVAATVSLSWQ